MRSASVRTSIAFVSLSFIAALPVSAQTAPRGDAGAGSPPYNPRVLSGVWMPLNAEGADARGRLESQWLKERLPMTAKGRAVFDSRSPGKGPRAALPAKGNDPLSDANVPGLLRSLVYGRPFQFIQTDDKVVQLFEWFRIWREMWTDGRNMPEDPGPRFYGYSVGRWEGNTFVVETTGLDPRLWGDEWGMPFSEHMRVTERWRRVDRENLELTLTFTDPETYTTSWTSDPRRFRLQPKTSPNGELLEVIFTPMDEQQFNRRIRNPSNGVQ
jgi:hypothetical protein